MSDVVTVNAAPDGSCVREGSVKSLQGKTFAGKVRIESTKETVTVTLVRCQLLGRNAELWADTSTGQLYCPTTLESLSSTNLRLIEEPVECARKIKRQKRYE